MKEIALTQGKVAIVDDADYIELSLYTWSFNSRGYAVRHRLKREGAGTQQIYMHRQIARCLEPDWVDHENHNTLDNRRSNLRICDRSKNTCNSRLLKRNKLGVKGVCFMSGKYRAKVFHQGKEVFRQLFDTIEEAKAAYDYHAKLHHKEFAHL